MGPPSRTMTALDMTHPQARHMAPGRGTFGPLGAYLVAVDDSHGVSIEVFETEEQARATAPPEGAEAPGVRVDTIQFGAVIGSA